MNLDSSIEKFHQKMKKYTKFYSTFSFKQLIKGPTRTTCSTSALIDPTLTNTQEYIL